MLILWFVTGASLVASLVALRGVRRASKRLEELSQLYWELRYQHGELRAKMQAGTSPTPQDPPAAPQRPAPDAFVPLSAVRR